MFLVGFKCPIFTALTYTSSRNVFHDITNNEIDYGLINSREKWMINRPCKVEAIPITRRHYENLFVMPVFLTSLPHLCHMSWKCLDVAILKMQGQIQIFGWRKVHRDTNASKYIYP